MWRLFIVVALTAGAATSVAAQEPEPSTREAALEQAQSRRPKPCIRTCPARLEALFNRAEDILDNGVPRWHPFFESAYYGGGFTLGAGYAHHVSPYNMLDVRGQLHDPGLQAHRSGVHGASSVPAAWFLVAARRLARGDASGLLRLRDGHVAGQSRRLRFSTAVRVGHAHALADTAPADAARRCGAVAVVAAARRRGSSHPSRRCTRRPHCPVLGPRPRISIPRAPSGSTGEPLPGIPGAAASTASRCTITPTRTSASASGRSTTRRSSTCRSCAKPG